MPSCSRCGGEVEFRYIKGRCIPLHTYGGGCGGSGRSEARDYAGYSRSRDEACFQTSCPECGAGAYFIRHNGGSVWIDPPLGPPWYKHPCMDQSYGQTGGTRSTLVSEFVLKDYWKRDGLVLGIVKEAETSPSKRCSLINIETGSNENIILLMKNNASFLVGRLILLDVHAQSVSWIEDESYTFRVVLPKMLPDDAAHAHRLLECPECTTTDSKVSASKIFEHLNRQHGFPRKLVISE